MCPKILFLCLKKWHAYTGVKNHLSVSRYRNPRWNGNFSTVFEPHVLTWVNDSFPQFVFFNMLPEPVP